MRLALWAHLKHFGSPFIGVWDPRLGYSYWQDEGYRTAAYYLRFGASLVKPWFSGLNSFADGIYSTLGRWRAGEFQFHVSAALELPAHGSSVLAGAFADGGSRHWWNLDFESFAKDTRPEWVLMLGLGILGVLALVQMSLAVPQRCVHQGVLYLVCVTPFCACAAWGFPGYGCAAAGCGQSWRAALRFGDDERDCVWIPHQSTRAVLAKAGALRVQARFAEAAAVLSRKCRKNRE